MRNKKLWVALVARLQNWPMILCLLAITVSVAPDPALHWGDLYDQENLAKIMILKIKIITSEISYRRH